MAVTGVSGSGKSSLVTQILYPALAARIWNARERPGAHDAIEGIDQVDKVIEIDQSPIGRTPRSNPATYTGLWAPLRELLAAVPESRLRGYKPGRFSFNVKGGRCEACEGAGIVQIEMHFLPDVYVQCEVCKGKRYNRETLEIHYKGRNVAEILEMTVDEALAFFSAVPSIRNKLQTLHDVGMGYIHLGQPATTLSGGEAQRVKLATELSKRATGQTLYILDEPTTGLHFDDVARLLQVLGRLVEAGNTVVVIEHNLDVIKSADWVIDLGPEGGAAGGDLVAAGTPEEVARAPAVLHRPPPPPRACAAHRLSGPCAGIIRSGASHPERRPMASRLVIVDVLLVDVGILAGGSIPLSASALSPMAPASSRDKIAQALMPNRSEAFDLLHEWNVNPSLRKHGVLVEAGVRGYARDDGLDPETVESWGIAGLLHDLDYERFPDAATHGAIGADELARLGYPDEVVHAVRAHNDALGVPREPPRPPRLRLRRAGRIPGGGGSDATVSQAGGRRAGQRPQADEGQGLRPRRPARDAAGRCRGARPRLRRARGAHGPLPVGRGSRGRPVAHLGQERRGPRRVEREDQSPGGTRERHVGEPALLLERTRRIGRSRQRAPVREALLLEADHHHRRPLAPLGAVDRHQLDRGGRVAQGAEPRQRGGVSGGQEAAEPAKGGGPAEQGIEGGMRVIAQRVVPVATSPARARLAGGEAFKGVRRATAICARRPAGSRRARPAAARSTMSHAASRRAARPSGPAELGSRARQETAAADLGRLSAGQGRHAIGPLGIGGRDHGDRSRHTAAARAGSIRFT